MTPPILRGAALLAALALVSATSAQPPLPPPDKQDAPQDAKKDDAIQPQPGIKVAEKGPIHEAFAQPGAETRGKGMTAPKKPPAPIPEVPPETKPDGDNVQWVPGYWQWDKEKEDFIWVSGFWRNVPPGRTWQAGEWVEKNGTWMYTPGFWRPTDMNNWRIDLPEPPSSVENGPNTPSEDPNAIWIPGQWEYRNEQYVWRPGYWAHPNGNQVWEPGQYLTTGSGYSYCPGYWDYPLEDRGLLYAPVYFTSPLWQTPGWYYTPSYALGLGLGYGGWGYGGLFGSLFCGSGFNNYYYGNYYNPWYTGGSWLGYGYPYWGSMFGLGFGLGSLYGWGGYYPWWYSGRGYYNHHWNHYCWLNRNNPNWAHNVRNAGFARAIGAAPHPATVASGGATRPLRISPANGIGGAAQTAARSAAARAASQPLIQPASQVARSLQTARANLHGTGASAPRVAGGNLGNAPRLGGGNGAGVTAGAGRSLRITPPVHAGSNTPAGSGLASPRINAGNWGGMPRLGGAGNAAGVIPGTSRSLQITPGGSRAISPGAFSGNQPTIRPGNIGGIRSIDRMGGLTNLPSYAAPTFRYGSSPGAFSSPSILGGGRGALPSTSYRPPMSSFPSYHPSYSNFGGAGRGLMVSPGGGARFGGFSGGHVGGFGGGHVGGFGGGHGGGFGGGHMGGGHGGGHGGHR